MAFYVGVVSLDFQQIRLHEKYMFNADETHLLIDQSHGRTYCMNGDKT